VQYFVDVSQEDIFGELFT